MPTVQPAVLQAFVSRVILGLGAEPDIAEEVARHLVRANLSGHDSHGVLRVTQYAAQVASGELAPSARPSLLRESPVTALIDAQRGFGHFSTAFALDWAIRHARDLGVSAVAVRHSSHIGRVGEYGERAAAAGLIAIVTVGAAGPGVGGMVLFGGRERFFGANPWCMAFPVAGRDPVLLDASSSTVAEGKVRLARDSGTALPSGCIIDADGRPTTNPHDFYAGGALSPLGGEVAGHKGYGLAMASALMGALSMVNDPDHTLIGASVIQDTGDHRGQAAGVFMAVFDPAAFGAPASYQALVRETVDAARRVPPAEGVEQILVPGEPETRNRAQREHDGIRLPDSTWADLSALGHRLGVELEIA